MQDKLINFLSAEYGLEVQDISAAKRGFYGETWKVQTSGADYFLKIDYWTHHIASYRNSLSAVQYMVDNGIDFIPQVIKTTNGILYSSFDKGTAALFEYVPGKLLGDTEVTVEQLYGKLARVYKLKPAVLDIETETFGTETAEAFLKLQRRNDLPNDVKKSLSEKQPDISKYIEKLNLFSEICRGNTENFYITHGDSGGNCILNGEKLFIVDWDSVKHAPIERDAWIFICDNCQLQKVNEVLKENKIDYILKQERLGYYCYYFFFYYLTEYLISVLEAADLEQKQAISDDLIGYLKNSWVYERLDTADKIDLNLNIK